MWRFRRQKVPIPKLYSQKTHGYRFYAKGHTKKHDKDPLNHYVLGAMLTFLVPYTGYAACIIIGSSNEINHRKQISKKLDQESAGCYESTLVKYTPLKVLGRYENPFDEYRVQTLYEFFFNRVVEVFQRNRGGIPNTRHEMRQLMPVHKPAWLQDRNKEQYNSDFAPLKFKILDKKDDSMVGKHNPQLQMGPISSTWLGQSCNFVMYKGLKILTDPLFSEFLIHETLGPKRISDMPCDITDVPTPDVILVSHNHPDHLDMKSLEYWKGGHPLWIVPEGMASFMKQHHVSNVVELSWWQTCEIDTLNDKFYITGTPAMHWSGRTLLDTNRSLWCSFLLSHNGSPIMFHAGDTGYVGDLFKRIRNRFGSGCKLALLPCGQYCPQWHQKPRHIKPEEVLKVMEDLGAQNVLGVHWGTFVLSGEYFKEPKEQLELFAEWKGVKDRCYCPELGRTEVFE